MMPRRLIILGVVIVVVGLAIALPLVFLLGGPSTKTPEGTVELYFKAMEEKDANKVADCFVPEMRDSVRSTMEFTFGMVESIEVSNLKIEVTSKTDTTATVKASYHYKAKYNGRVDEGGLTEYYDLQKVNGEWLITSF